MLFMSTGFRIAKIELKVTLPVKFCNTVFDDTRLVNEMHTNCSKNTQVLSIRAKILVLNVTNMPPQCVIQLRQRGVNIL